MNQYYCLIGALLILCFSGSIKAQNDSLMPNYEGAYVYYHYEINNPPGDQWNVQYVSTYGITSNDTMEVYTSSLVGHLAFTGNKVYAKLNSLNGDLNANYSQSFSLLYNYDLQIGDTAYHKPQYPPAILEQITSFDMNGHLVPHFHFSNGDSWIKGIGSTLHPFFPFVRQFEITYLYCGSQGYYDGSSPLDYYVFSPEPNHPYCQLELEEIDSKITLRVAPNPVGEWLEIISEEGIPQSIEISTISGKSILYKINTNAINVALLPSGTYLVRVILDDQEKIIKFLKE